MADLTVELGNWGLISCQNEQHRAYLIAAWDYSQLRSAVRSWERAWLNTAMEREYTEAEQTAKAKCDLLWEAIPNRHDIRKSH